MIKLNEQYSINNGQGSIVFSEGNKGTINAVYEIKGKKDTGVINGVLEGNLLKGTWNNKIGNTTGLIEFAFNETGFDAKWKQGIEPGPMRGKWEGEIGFKINQENTIIKVLSEEQKQYLEEGITLEDFDEEYQGSDEGKVSWMKDRTFLLEAVKHDFRILKYASDELKADRELVLEAIKQDIAAIDYAYEKLQCDPEILSFRIDTYFYGCDNINISDDDLTIFLTNNSNPSILIEKLLFKVEFLFLKNKKEEVKFFHKKLIDFINANHECYWILVGVSRLTISIYEKFDNYSYTGDENAKRKIDEIAELEKLITFDIDFQPEIEFETYFNDTEIRNNWDDCKWKSSEDEEGLPFSEFIMNKTDMEWNTESWDDAKFYNYAISSVWIALLNYSLKHSREGLDEENMAVCLYSFIDEKYDPIRESGCADYGIYTFRTIIEFLFGMKKNDYDLNETFRDDLEEFNGWQFDLNKVASEICNSDLFDDWPGASEFEK